MKAKESMAFSASKKTFGKRAWIAAATAALMVAAMAALAGCAANAVEGGEPAIQADASQAVAATQSALEEVAVGSAARGAQATCPGYVDEDGDGICDNCGTTCGSCPGFVDADGDGVCDNYGTGNGYSCGNGGGHHGAGHGCGRW